MDFDVTARKFGGFNRGLLRALVVVFTVGMIFIAADYLRFVNKIARVGSAPDVIGHVNSADAVVVLTGGANRISTGVDLLKSNHGRRLLISGVGESTTRADLGRILKDPSTMYGCCIDIDRVSLNTRGNAAQTADWVELHNFNEILLVTSSYHMPRSLMLLEESMPDVTFVGVPVQPPDWKNTGFLKLLISPVILKEYAKYRVAAFGIEPSVQLISAALEPNESHPNS
ncbi:MAG: YdcF family protein [Rhizobiaceae bacterium]|nr:YdcF family protein [Rhizobiaceae bacterium]